MEADLMRSESGRDQCVVKCGTAYGEITGPAKLQEDQINFEKILGDSL